MNTWKRISQFIDVAWPIVVILTSLVGMIYMAVADVFMVGWGLMFFIFFCGGIYELWEERKKGRIHRS